MKRLALFLWSFLGAVALAKPSIVVGSKVFTESYILAEIASQVIERTGEADVDRRFGLGQTGIAFEALRNARVDLYPEYTGTIAEAILKIPVLNDPDDLRPLLQEKGMTLSRTLGFNNTYALAVPTSLAREKNLTTLSQLKEHSGLRAGFSHEFVNRPDCYSRIKSVYGIQFPNLKALAHSLAYDAIRDGTIDITDIYSTDAKVAKLQLTVLTDDKHAFPDYQAVFLARAGFPDRFPRSWKALQAVRIDEKEMVRLNSLVEMEHKSFAEAAGDFLSRQGSPGAPGRGGLSGVQKIWVLGTQHAVLVFASLLVSLLVGVPLAIVGARSRLAGQTILLLSGLIQTIPSLALLCFLIPLFGIGTLPALVALFLYGLLPIVRNTYLGLTQVDPSLREVARSLGLTPMQQLWRVEIPLAMPAIMGGVKTSAIINVGTATLAALIGAGGFGVPIVTGLALNDIPTILRGAVPAAGMALGVHGLFELLDRSLVSRGLRIKRH